MFSVQLISSGRKMRSLNQESVSCVLNSVSVLKQKGPSEKVSHSAVRQVRHSNDSSLLFLVIDLVHFSSLLPLNALEQARKQGGWAVAFGVSTSTLSPRKQCKKSSSQTTQAHGPGASELASQILSPGPLCKLSIDLSYSSGDFQPWVYHQHSI